MAYVFWSFLINSISSISIYITSYSFCFIIISSSWILRAISSLAASIFCLRNSSTLSCFHFLFLAFKMLLLVESRFVLLINEFSLFGFLLLVNKYCVLYLFLLHITLSSHSPQLFPLHLLSLLFFCHHILLASVSFLVLHLSFDYIAGSPLRLFDLLPSLHFFLFQKCDSVRQ